MTNPTLLLSHANPSTPAITHEYAEKKDSVMILGGDAVREKGAVINYIIFPLLFSGLLFKVNSVCQIKNRKLFSDRNSSRKKMFLK